MTFKEIWASFCDNAKEQGIKAWEGIKQVCSSSFKILKDSVIGLFTGIYNWLVETITGTGKLIWALLTFIFTSLGSAIIGSLQAILNKLVDWVMKW